MPDEKPNDKKTEEVKEEVKEVEEAPAVEPEQEEVEEKEDVKEEKEETKEDKQKKRTAEQFEKLTKNNKELKELTKKNVLDSLIPESPKYPDAPTTNVVPQAKQFPGLSQEEIAKTFGDLVDSDGYVDSGLLIDTLKELKTKNTEAEKRATVAEQKVEQVARNFDDFQRNELMRKVHRKYPKLNPEKEEVFDERLWEAVRNEVIGQWTSGQQENVMAAAEKWSKILYKEEETVKKADKEKLEKTETDKKNINALGVKSKSQRTDWEEAADLAKATLKGEPGALAERLRRAGQ